MKKKQSLIKVMMLVMMLVVCMSVPAEAATLRSGTYTYSTKTRGRFGKEKTTIYKQRSGGKKQKLTTVSGRIYDLHYVYGNKLYYTRFYGDSAPSPFDVETLNLKNNKRAKLVSNLQIIGHRGRYAMIMPANDLDVQPLYIIDVKTKKTKWIAGNVLYGASNIMKNGKIYYLHCDKLNYGSGKSKYSVYSCNKNGSGKKRLRTFYSKATNIKKITDNYVVVGAYGMKNEKYYY